MSFLQKLRNSKKHSQRMFFKITTCLESLCGLSLNTFQLYELYIFLKWSFTKSEAAKF